MSFETTSLPSLLAEVSIDGPPPLGQRRSNAHVETLDKKSQLSAKTHKVIKHENIKTNGGPNEGRVHLDGTAPHSNSVSPSLSLSVVERHLNRAKIQFDRENFDGGAEELIAAAERLSKHQNMVQGAFKQAISTLTTIGNKSTPPHPKALSLIRARQTLKL